MASEVEICNLALAHIGDSATVSSIDPPEGSAQSEHCARFYPMARDVLLDDHTWSFATKRVALAELTNESTTWQYAYAVPNDCLDVMAIIDSTATNDYNGTNGSQDVYTYIPTSFSPQEYAVEVDSTGADVIYTNQANAVCRYTTSVTDTSKFPPLLVVAISYQLASFLAGPIIKGETGSAMTTKFLQLAQAFLSKAKSSDSMQRQIKVDHNVPWIAGR
jgi:hypothetical protein